MKNNSTTTKLLLENITTQLYLGVKTRQFAQYKFLYNRAFMQQSSKNYFTSTERISRQFGALNGKASFAISNNSQINQVKEEQRTKHYNLYQKQTQSSYEEIPYEQQLSQSQQKQIKIALKFLPKEVYSGSIREVDDFYQNKYRPFESLESIHQMVAMLILLNTLHPNSVKKLHFFNKVVNQLKDYLKKSLYFEERFITVCLLFYKTVAQQFDREVLELIYKRANSSFAILEYSDLSILCLNTGLFESSDKEDIISVKIDFLNKLEQYIIKNEDLIKQISRREQIEKIIIGYAASKVGSEQFWQILTQIFSYKLQSDPVKDFEHKSDILAIIHSLSIRVIQNREIWSQLMKRVQMQMNQKNLVLKDLTYLLYDMYLIKMQSPKFFDLIIQYFFDQNYNEIDLLQLGCRLSVNFIYHLAYLHGDLNNKEFFKIMRKFIIGNKDEMTKYQLIKMVDIFKFFKHLEDQGLKTLLEKQLELQRIEYKNESSEEEENRFKKITF